MHRPLHVGTALPRHRCLLRPAGIPFEVRVSGPQDRCSTAVRWFTVVVSGGAAVFVVTTPRRIFTAPTRFDSQHVGDLDDR